MKLELTGIKQISLNTEPSVKQNNGWLEADVQYCAICRTDAKLWTEGHRDLVLPRVPGHEMVVSVNGTNYAVWPGTCCGECKYCKSGDENLCEDMEIIGFHHDGGFASKISVPESSLVELPKGLSLVHTCFAEPAGCAMNAFKKLTLKGNERILIIGGGTVGLLTAAMAKVLGAKPVVIEKNETKIKKAAEFQKLTNIPILKDTNESKFDCVLNACADPLALMSGITRLAKAGRFVHFSGLSKNENLETNLLNLIHYKEFIISGAYGHTKQDLENGLHILRKLSVELDLLIEDIIKPEQAIDCLQDVIDGKVYKYIIDFTGAENTAKTVTKTVKVEKKITSFHEISARIGVGDIKPLSEELFAKAQEKIDNKTKPLGALGTLERLSVQLSLIQNSLTPAIKRKALIVFAADHGIAEEGVSAFPQEVTGQMVENFVKQGAAINVLCKHNNIDLVIVDVGVKSDLILHPDIINERVANGTQNFALQPAMTEEQVYAALKVGVDTFNKMYSKEPIDILGLGEMGIANTSSATAIISVVTKESVDSCAGRGTGVDNQALEHKVKVIKKALAFHKPTSHNAIEILQKVGGFEIAAIAGAALAAAAKGCAVVLDGLISTSAGLAAYLINAEAGKYFIAGHKSVEQGHIYALKHMGLEPVLDLGMRLGEGTGAALTINLVEASAKIMCDMATFESAGVSKKNAVY